MAENQTLNIARWDTEGHYLYINSAHERTLGKSAGGVVGTIIPDSRKTLKAKIDEVVATGELTLLVELSVPNKDGSNHRHDLILVPERSSEGKIVSVLGIGRDMTNFYPKELPESRWDQAFLETRHRASTTRAAHSCNRDGLQAPDTCHLSVAIIRKQEIVLSD